LFGTNSFSIVARAHEAMDLKKKDRAAGRRVLGFSAKYAPALAALAFAFLLVGLGFANRYHSQQSSQLQHAIPAPSQAVADFSPGPQSSVAAHLFRLRLRSRIISDTQPLPPATLRTFRLRAHRTRILFSEEQRPASFRFLIPFRSPPPDRISLV
jgi:hypothetical protein